MHDYSLAHRNTTGPFSTTVRRCVFSHDYIQADFSEGVKMWCWSLCASFTVTQQQGEGSGGHACTVQMNEVKFRAPSAHPRPPWFIRKVWWRWLLRQPRSALWVTESTRGKYWGNPSFTHRPGRTMCLQYYQMWCLCLVCLGKWGPVGVFFWKVSDKLSPCLLLTPFPNPARSCFADRSAKREKPELHGEIILQFIQVAA